MMIKLKKPGLQCSVFFIGLSTLLLGFEAKGDVTCEGMTFSGSISRSDMAGISSDEEGFPEITKSGTIINQKVDLNIQADLAALANGTVTAESVDWVWHLTASKKHKSQLEDNIVANYQFSSLGGADTICSSSGSCLDILNVVTNISYANSGKYLDAWGSITLTLGINGASEAGNYQADLSITLHDSMTNESLCP